MSLARRLGVSERGILIVQANLANSYAMLGRSEEGLRLRRDVYSGWLRLEGEEDPTTLIEASNYANSLIDLQRFEEAKSLLRKTTPVTRRVLGESQELTLKMRWNYAAVLCKDEGATLADLREAVATFEDAGRIARRVLGSAHPLNVDIERHLGLSRAALDAREAASA